MDNNLLSVKETAELLGVSPSSVRKWANLGELNTMYDKSTGNRMFEKQQVLNFKTKLQSESKDLTIIGFGIDKINQFSNSFYGKLLKYVFFILFILLIIVGVSTIINLQAQVKSLKESNDKNFKVVENLSNKFDNDNLLLQKDVLKKQQAIDNATQSTNTSKSYGKIVLNIDDAMLGILGGSKIENEKKINAVNNTEIKDLLKQSISPEFFIESSTKLVNKVTMHDTITGNIYCVLVSNGKLITLEGYCKE